MSAVKLAWEIPAQLGEGPVWVEAENAVYWVDIYRNQAHRYSLADGAKKTWTFDFAVTSLNPRRGGGFVGTIKDGFVAIDFDNLSVDPIQLPEADLPNNRFNDGKVDKSGRYWAGTMDLDQSAETGALYRLDPDLSVSKVDDDYIICNGPTFSLDNSIIYHTDSIKRKIYALDIGADGSLSNKRLFAEFTKDTDGVPDGMTTDSEDCLWVAHFGGARVTRYSPAGEILQVVPIPALNITSCAFAGADLDTLYIVTASTAMSDEQLKQYPLAGSLFSYQPGVKGVPTPLFAG
ncbi:MAG: SMP-30/gluconolactonase/LRE family protein [Chloroflexota bacterium]|nr:SMP-30/gluconolactonase/LRE family protein [Chloroflexota bacterium]